MSTENDVVFIATRINKELHAKLLKRQRDAQRLTGFKPSISAVLRVLIEEAPVGPKRARGGRAA